jgi:hypothetical protein
MLSGWLEGNILYPGIENFVLGVKCVSDIRAMSIHFSVKVVISSFLWLVRLFSFHKRMVNDCAVKDLFMILSEKTVEH